MSKCLQDYNGNWFDFSAVAVWLKAFFPFLLKLKKQWSSQLDATGQIKERNWSLDYWCWIWSSWKPRRECFWRFSTISLSDSSVRCSAFVKLLCWWLWSRLCCLKPFWSLKAAQCKSCITCIVYVSSLIPWNLMLTVRVHWDTWNNNFSALLITLNRHID